MKKFQKMLLLSDYDNTLCYTEATLREGRSLPPVSPRNLEAIRHWMEEGGRFAVATGRALAAFRQQAREIPMNAPMIVDNGGGLYDLAGEKYLLKHFLPAASLGRIAAVMEAFPLVSLELYYEDGLLQVLRETDWNRQHAMLTGLPYERLERLEERPGAPALVKALFVSEKAELDRAYGFMVQRGMAEEYELIFSSDHLLELTAKGANKGDMALRLKELCGCEKLFCAGDHANDLAMLRAADRGFAPTNAIAEVLESGAEVVCHCSEGAIADIVELLEEEI